MWITFTAASVASRLTGPEMTALKSAAKASGQDGDELLSDCIDRAVREVRGSVAGCSRNTLGEEGTIPDELEDATLAIVIYRFISRLPGAAAKALLGQIRSTNYEDARDLLKQVAACKFGIVPPETPGDDQAAGPAAELISSRDRTAKRSDTDGLL
jgi:hypothetical protein